MKQLICKQIYRKRIGDGENCSVFIRDIPPDLLPGDEININRDEGFYSENESWDAFTELVIKRLVMENDEEYNKRIEREQRDKKFKREQRYKNYLKLKEEFENGSQD